MCWIAFVAVWIAAWLHDRRYAAEVRKREPFPSWLLIVVLAYILTGVIVPRGAWSHLAFRPQPGVQYAGTIVVVLSTAFAIWARIVLGTMWSALAIVKVGHQLRTTGPYSITRHPIYTAILGMSIGSTMAQGGGIWFLAFVTIALAVLTKIHSEEQLLVQTFGDDYRSYQRRVALIIPFVRLPG
jgi:protein-S-isoprenylcysteine O-methyltransferase Ste14